MALNQWWPIRYQMKQRGVAGGLGAAILWLLGCFSGLVDQPGHRPSMAQQKASGETDRARIAPLPDSPHCRLLNLSATLHHHSHLAALILAAWERETMRTEGNILRALDRCE